MADEIGISASYLNHLERNQRPVTAGILLRLAEAFDIDVKAFATEAGQFQAAGLSAIVCGPGSILQAHQPDEFIELSQVQAGEAFLRKLIAWAQQG